MTDSEKGMMLTSVFIVYRDRYAIVYAPLVVVKVDLIASKYLIVGVFLVGWNPVLTKIK